MPEPDIQVASNEPEESDEPENGGWTRRDVWLGLLFLTIGVLISFVVYLMYERGVRRWVWASGWIGPVFVLLGLNGVVRSLIARE